MQTKLEFEPFSSVASRVWMSRSVRQHAELGARAPMPGTSLLRVPAQQPDRKLDGEPGKRRAKRPCEETEDDMEVACAMTASERGWDDANATAPRPPSPLGEQVESDDDDACAAAARKKDKDVVPSRMTWAWSPAHSAWALRPRPRLALAGPFFAFHPVPSKHTELLRILLNAPDSPLHEDFLRAELVPRLNRNHRVSLRALDWLMVDYSCENKAVYMWKVGDGLDLVDIHEKYTRLLKCWRRRRFDCFRRRHRIYFELDGSIYPTTVAQLHFFYVAARYGFLEYAAVFLDEIDAHMKATFVAKEAQKAAPKTGTGPKRQALVTKAKPRVFVNASPKSWSFKYPDVADSSDEDDLDA